VSDARILVVDDEENIRVLLDEILSEEGYDVTTAEDAEHARQARRAQSFDLTLLDIWMPDTDGISLLKEWAEGGSLGPVVMMSGHATIDTAVEATRLGALDFIEKPVSLSQLLRTVSKALAGRQTGRSPGSISGRSSIVGKSEEMQALRDRLEAAAGHDANLMLTGEPGSGRSLAARYLATLSSRAAGPFEVVDCAGLSEAAAIGELLGVNGNPGRLARAAGGILYLRGLESLSPQAQHQSSGWLRLASETGPDRHDVRIICAAPPGFERETQLPPELMRLVSSIVIRVPALRQHAEDVPELLRYYVDRFVEVDRLPFRRFGIAAQNRLRNYPWPGNIAELERLVRQMLVFGSDEDIGLAEVEAELAVEPASSEQLVEKDLLAMPLREAREHFERAYLKQQLQLCGGKVGQLAKRVGMERTHLYRKLRGLGVDFRQASQDD